MPVLPSGVVASQGWGVGSAVPAPLLGHSRTFPAQLWELSSALRFSWNFVGGNVAGEISTCHEQIHLIRERGLTFFCVSGRLNCAVCALGVEEEGSGECGMEIHPNGKGKKSPKGWVCCPKAALAAGGNPGGDGK